MKAVVTSGPRWLVTGKADGPIAELCDEVIVCTPEIEESWCHTASYTAAVAAIAALLGEDIGWLPGAVEEALTAGAPAFGQQERFIVAGAGRDLATAHEAVLKLREGAWVAAEPYETEQLLHGYLAAIDESVRAFVLEGEGRGAERAQDAVAALEALGCETTLVPTHDPVVDIVYFHLLTLAASEARGIDPDPEAPVRRPAVVVVLAGVGDGLADRRTVGPARILASAARCSPAAVVDRVGDAGAVLVVAVAGVAGGRADLAT